ncbi:CCR4-NOT transcription complex subunit 10 isoform X1 [Punica granatum]|uniref:CCR4-NOT transcription complex subunit 10 isoform X1 n=1 Tax=Punica granatum TaxID=22663 RepID=A0A218W091_PUNGR|nr:CCR4-NOT transcription complex subunit 10 isoform X1 [Punica granatum]OWM65939.1 hypothetical protein CDL15_Pgr015364 [Punica granatum]
MDSRDSSATSNSVVNPSADEEGAPFSAVAKEAALLFQSRKYTECLELLHQLAQKKEHDPKVLHNIAITEFFWDGCSNPRRLIEVLSDVKRKSEVLARTSLEQVEATSNAGSRGTLGSKGNASAPEHQISVANNTSIFYVDEFDHSVAILNIAVIWFHLSEYSKALSILEPLYNKIQPIDETIALHICLLLLDVALACHDIAKSADVLNYLEKPLDNGTAIQQQSANLVVKSSSVPSNSAVADNSDLGTSAGLNTSDKSLARTLSDETLDYESMMSALDIGGHNLGSSQALSSSNNFSRSVFDKSLPSVDLKLKLQLYKVRFLLLSGNLKAAKREVKGAMNARGDSSIAILLKSQLEYARGNYRKAIKLLMALENRTEGAIGSMFFNNLGCIYHELAKFHTASIFFTKALTSSSSLRKEKPLRLSTLSQDKSLFISYNCGVQNLASGKPVLAARCLLKAQTAFYNKPLFWFRLAECCLMASEMGLLKNGGVSLESSELKLYVIGKGKWRRLAIKDESSRNGLSHSAEKTDWSISSNDGQPKLSLSLARLCLYNALHILSSCESGLHSSSSSPLDSSEVNDSSETRNVNHKILQGVEAKLSAMNLGLSQVTSNGDTKEQKAVVSQELISSSLSIYEETSRRKNKIVKEAVTANQAFVELELENPIGALSCARSLLQIPDCSRVYAFLGHMYAAEALCLLNRPSEASEHLSVYLAEGKNMRLPFTEEDFEQWRVVKNSECEETNNGGGPVSSIISRSEEPQILTFLKPEEARAALYVNLAAKSAMDGELQKALELVNQALVMSANSREALLTSVYIHLALGNSREALSKLKQLSRVRFLPFPVSSESS